MRLFLTVLAATSLTVSLEAQLAPRAQTAGVATPAPSVPSDTYSYQPEGRRDPFVSQQMSGIDPRATLKRGDGLSGLALAEVSVRGVIESHDALVGMVLGPDNKTYLVHQGDKLADGVVKSVTTQGLVVMQDVNDPLSTQKQREVRKLLRSLEGGK